jgi:hypothetical protein
MSKEHSPIVDGKHAITVSNIAAAPLLADNAAPTMDTFRDEEATAGIKRVERK